MTFSTVRLYPSGLFIVVMACAGATASAADLAVSHTNGALLFPVAPQLVGSASEQGLIQDQRDVDIPPGSKSIRVPDGTTVHVVSETTVSYQNAAGATVVVPVVRVKVTSSGLTNGSTGQAIGYQATAGFMLKERLQ